ncbi:hypothetical protein DH2020_007926 [Rehmannia glutinosa]|uniref:Myb-like domain-containing protein n=1 Tax=Rehmannia glutinosa TaxID=99300 RepID=A0ABR0TZL7_REHGL
MGSSGDGAADAHESGGASGGSSEVGASSSIPGGGGMEEIERSGGGGGNRWPRQETLALLKIRSDMDVTFRDSSLKGPLWEEKNGGAWISTKRQEMQREIRERVQVPQENQRWPSIKIRRQNISFFDQLEALENTPPPPFNPPPPRPAVAIAPPPPMPTANANSLPMPSHTTHVSSSTSPNPISVAPPAQTAINSSSPFQLQSQPPFQPPPPPAAMNTSNPPQIHTFHQPSHPHIPASLLSNSTSTSSTSSDEDIQRRRGRKRKWKDYFQRLMKDVIHKQEELQKKFLDTLEKRERDRIAREEAWRVQEMARINREHELLAQERSIAAAKDAAVIAFLQKVTEQNNLQIPIGNNAPPPQVVPMQAAPTPDNTQPPPPQPPRQPPPPTPSLQLSTLPPPPVAPQKPISAPPPVSTATPTKFLESSKTDNGGGGDNSISASSSRWPKAEVQALIDLRTSLDLKYQENGPKGPLWEEISAAMAKLGYNRSSKRCKEKWENINKYFKKVKESNKKRPEDSKTCPYFHQLDALYKEKSKNDVVPFNPGYPIHPENPMAPIMARPEQQWPVLPEQQQQQDEDNDSENNDQEEDDDEDEEDEGGGNYEIVTKKQPSSVTTNTAE